MLPIANLNEVFGKYSRSILTIGVIGFAGWSWNYFWMNRRIYRNDISLKGKTALITGANSGLGYQAAKNFLQRGARVVLACRNLNKGHQCLNQLINECQCDEDNIVLMKCDLSSFKSIKDFAENYLLNEERLDLLICNAGLGRSSIKFSENNFDQVIQSNYLGHFLLVDLLKEKLEKCRPSRIIHVSSDLHQMVQSIANDDWPDLFYQENNRSLMGSYPYSKLFQILSTFYCKQTFIEKGINVFSVTPGWVSTSIEDPNEQSIPIYARLFYRCFIWIMKLFFAKTPEKGSETIIYCSIEPTIENSKEIYFQNCRVSRTSQLAKDFNLAERLWNFTAQTLNRSIKNF